MKTSISIALLLVVFAVVFAGRSFGQAAPTVTQAQTQTPAGTTSPRLSWVDGTVHYALTASEVVQYGYYGSGNTTSATALSGVGNVFHCGQAPAIEPHERRRNVFGAAFGEHAARHVQVVLGGRLGQGRIG